ncbi:DUF349 domain-containing protein [Weeksella virosa]|uniref:DUF349 domain-containing protein n=1 Tax=Weeksella virosa TaxID=1014 RepID=UPI002556CD66|nr:DUF349 domain-containing protein [Weeksella virosa]MDK7375727.1 DUF349 domain-containing protein [Weeksella virosa]
MITDMDNLQNADGKSPNNTNESYKSEAIQEEQNQNVIPLKDYEKFDLEILLNEARILLKNHPAQELKEHFSLIREAAKNKMALDAAEKREQFVNEGGDEIHFRYDSPLKKEFYVIYEDYKKQLSFFYKETERTEKENLEKRLEIIEELKALYQDPQENNQNLFRIFRDLKTRWHNAGRVPAAQANNVYRNYFFHLDNFYKYLDMNKELRELDMSHNLEVRQSIIKRAEELVSEENVQKALNELQYLHRLWKEEAVPVAEEFREVTWNQFKELTNKIHNRKAELNELLKKEQEDNLAKKRAIVQSINEITQNSRDNKHGDWQKAIRKVNDLREEFLKTGRVPKPHNNEIWDEFKQSTRNFNHLKNTFYKNLKSNQEDNLQQKIALIEIAKEHAESTDWNKSVKVIKQIQEDWKKVGHVPRKHSDRVWKEFKKYCNQFFDRYKKRNEAENEKLEQNLSEKKQLIETVKNYTTAGDKEKDLTWIFELEKSFNSIGKVPMKNINIANQFREEIDKKVKELAISDEEMQDFRLQAIFNKAKTGKNAHLIDNEIIHTKKEIDDLDKEIIQLDNNISFFSGTDQNSPLLKNVYKELEEKKNKRNDLNQKLRKLYQYNSEENNEKELDNSEDNQV